MRWPRPWPSRRGRSILHHFTEETQPAIPSIRAVGRQQRKHLFNMSPRDRSQVNAGGQPPKRMPQGIENTFERASLPVNELMAKVAFDLRAQVRINQGGKIDDVACGRNMPWII